MEDHYKTLGIERSATPEEVKKAYFEMAKKYHPDSGDESEIKKFHAVAGAYKILSDAKDRKTYDVSLGSFGTEAKAAGTDSVHATSHIGKRDSYRDDELKEFHKNRYKKAVFRVVLFSAFLGVVGGVVGLILGGRLILGCTAGVCVGFSFSINRNFNVKTFFKSDKAHKLFRLFTWLLFLGGLGYFAWLIVGDLILA